MTKEIQELICRQEIEKGNIVSENFNYLFCGELDVLSYTKSGFSHEWEVKISKSDFKADAKKKKWDFFRGEKTWLSVPNYFWYVCPKDLIKEEELLHDWMGLVYYDSEIKSLTVIRKAKLIHKDKKEPLGLLQKIARQNNWKHYFGATQMTVKNDRIFDANAKQFEKMYKSELEANRQLRNYISDLHNQLRQYERASRN